VCESTFDVQNFETTVYFWIDYVWRSIRSRL